MRYSEILQELEHQNNYLIRLLRNDYFKANEIVQQQKDVFEELIQTTKQLNYFIAHGNFNV